MKVKTWIKYEESYLPPRCRKLRYRECEEFVEITLPEAKMDSLQLAFEDNSFFGKGKIYFYRGKLWAQAKLSDPNWAEAVLTFVSVGIENITDERRPEMLLLKRREMISAPICL